MLRLRALAVFVGSASLACTFDTSGGPNPEDTGGSMSTAGQQAPEATETSRTGSDETHREPWQPSGSSDEGDSTGENGTSSGEPGLHPAPRWCDQAMHLVGCWDMEEAASGSLLDGSGHGNDGTVLNAEPLSGSPSSAGSAVLVSSATEMQIPDSRSLDIAGALTVEVWVNPEVLGHDGGRAGILDNDGQYGVFLEPAGWYCDAGARVESVPAELGVWTHLACVYDGSQTMLYINGQLRSSNLAAPALGIDNTNAIAVANTSPDWNQPFVGGIGGLRIWREARSPEAICKAAGCPGP
jgi:hypothetical protein